MKVLQIANGYLGNRLYENLFSALRGVGVDSAVYVPINRGDPDPPPVGEGVAVSKCFNNLDRVLFFPKQRNMLRDMESRFDLKSVDAVHAHTVFSGGYAALQLKKRRGLPYITSVRNTDVNVFFKQMPYLRPVGLRVLREAERIIFLSPAYREQLFSQYVPAPLRQELEAKSLVIPNGIAPLFFENAPHKKALSNPPRLIYVGEISSNKNLELTVQAAERLRQGGLEVRLTAVGAVREEKYRPLLQRDLIEHHDRCPQTEVIRHLRRADMFVMPSHTETFGLVYAEAMSQGLPVLYTRGQGFDGQFPDGTVGYSVSDTDPAELADRIGRVLSQYDALSENCLRLVGKFRWEKIAEQYAGLYNQITTRGAAGIRQKEKE